MRTGLGVIAATLALALAPAALAQGQGHGKGQGRGGPPDHVQPAPTTAPAPRGSASVSVTIGAADQGVIRQYYGQQASQGFCPPGLAKKNNGCMPPGQAKKWAIGQPLPAGVAYFALPPALLGRLTPAPNGYAYVQVGSDVLLMGVATRIIASAVAIF
ncbi:MAG: RcnB family protein [Alphaproteobacteria bacterium]|nr:RcnB family protein [Alphaproteobacteria bacterium]